MRKAATPPAPPTTPPAEASDLTVGLVYDLGGRGDQSFNDSAAAGLDQAVAEFGIEAEELEPDEGGENRQELLQLLCDNGTNLIFAVGFLNSEAIGAVAPNCPDSTFAIVDDAASDRAQPRQPRLRRRAGLVPGRRRRGHSPPRPTTSASSAG